MQNLKLIAVVVLLSALGCERPPQHDRPAPGPAAAPPPPPSPAAESFKELLDQSVAELKAKNEANKAWGLGAFDQWDLDQEVGNLVFSNADGKTATAPAQIIGSYSKNDNSWLWAWDNPSIVDALKQDALIVKKYGEKHGIEKLTTRKWTGTEDDAWAMVALAAKLCGARGAYRGPSGKSYVFMTFGEVKIGKATSKND